MKAFIFLTLIAIALPLAGCGNVNQKLPPWKCFDGLAYVYVNNAWVQVDGHYYMNLPDGPVKCVPARDQGNEK